jgi:hypothetical protein
MYLQIARKKHVRTIFQCHIGVLEELTLLGVHTSSISRRDREEGCIECGEIFFEEMCSFDRNLKVSVRENFQKR